MQGLENVKEDDRAEFFKHFLVSAAEQKAYNKEHPPPADQPSPPPAKKQKVVSLVGLLTIIVTSQSFCLYMHTSNNTASPLKCCVLQTPHCCITTQTNKHSTLGTSGQQTG